MEQIAVNETRPSRPRPERAAVLMCDPCATPQPHTFVASRRSGEVGAFEEVFRCAKCNTERRYGLVTS
jgi:RNase P subunit RPR2